MAPTIGFPAPVFLQADGSVKGGFACDGGMTLVDESWALI